MIKDRSQKPEARSKTTYLLFTAYCLLLTAYCLLFFASAVQAEVGKDVHKIDRIVVLPMANISGNLDARAIIDSLLQKELEKRGFELVPYEDVDKFLTKRRIRNTSFIDRITTLELNRELGVDAVVLGSIDQYSNVSNEIYVGLTLRLVGTRDCSIIWMDTVSYAGSDFAGLLGIGRVKLLVQLGAVAVSNIVGGIPREYLLKDRRDDNLFEIGNLKISPSIVRGGKSAKVSVKIISVVEKIVKVQAYIGEMKFDLKDGDGDYYDGEITVPYADGLYPVDIIAVLSDDKISHFPSVGEVKVDTVSPEVTVSTDKDVTAGLVKKDSIIFTLKTNEVIEKWEVEIVDKENKFVRGERGFGALPMQLMWRGENNAGSRNDDGIYYLNLTVWDTAGNAGVFQKKIILDATPPAVKIEAEATDDNDVVIFNLDYEENEMMEKWEFVILGEDSKIIKNLSGRGNVAKKLIIPLISENREVTAGGGKIMYAFKAVDKAGNIFKTSNQTIAFSKKEKEKFAKRNEKLQFGWGESDF